MVFENRFYAGDALRWNLGWASPNYAGIFLATLIPICWRVRSGRFCRLGAWFAEAAGFFLLAKTYSRGALVALVCGGVFVALSERARERIREWGLRAGLLSTIVLATGFSRRLDPAGLTADHSVTNRLRIWRGCLEMLWAEPWRGWGTGESGTVYMNWFRNLGRTEAVLGPVNSFLHVASELGLPVFVLATTVLFALVVAAWGAARRGDAAAGWAGAVWVAWLVGNVFSTLWLEASLWCVPIVALVVIVRRCSIPRGRRECLPFGCLRSGCLAALGLSLGLCLTGALFSLREPWRISRDGNHCVELTLKRGAKTMEESWDVYPDRTVLGSVPGDALRSWMEGFGAGGSLHVYSAFSPGLSPHLAARTGVMLFGRQAERLSFIVSAVGTKRLWIVHPLVPPRTAGPIRPSVKEIVVVLPSVDEVGLSAAWRRWAGSVGARVVITPLSGEDVRAHWLEIAPAV